MTAKKATSPKRTAKLRHGKKLEPQKPLALTAYLNLPGQKTGKL
jgi:hypothetical protein